jgi:hypothetical protein
MHADNDPSKRGGNDARLAGPGEEDDLLPRPRAAPVDEQAREDDERPGDEDERRENCKGGPEMVGHCAPGQVRPERDEYEHHHRMRHRRDERAHLVLVVGVHAEAEERHVAEDEAGEERAEIAASSGGVDGEEASRDDGDDDDRRGLAPDAGAPARDNG